MQNAQCLMHGAYRTMHLGESSKQTSKWLLSFGASNMLYAACGM